MGRPSKWSPEFREEAVRLYRSGRGSIPRVRQRIGVHPQTFRKWVRQAEILALYERSRDTSGAPRIKDRLRIDQ